MNSKFVIVLFGKKYLEGGRLAAGIKKNGEKVFFSGCHYPGSAGSRTIQLKNYRLETMTTRMTPDE